MKRLRPDWALDCSTEGLFAPHKKAWRRVTRKAWEALDGGKPHFRVSNMARLLAVAGVPMRKMLWGIYG